MNDNLILVPLVPETVAALIRLRSNDGESLDGVIHRLAERSPGNSAPPMASVPSGRHCATLHGTRVVTGSLKDLLSRILNLLADRDDAFLERLSEKHGRTRRHVARTRDAIHPGRDDLNRKYTVEFRTGWWMGTNYSKADVRRILKAACRAAGLSFGHDLMFER